jgi:hypothetical protein
MAGDSWVRTRQDFPSGGLELQAEYREGNHSSKNHLPAIGSVIKQALGCSYVFEGSLNLHAAEPFGFPNPARVTCNGADWCFAPVIIDESVVGVAARRPPPDNTEFLEVFACDELAPILGISYGQQVTVRILPGSHLGLAA